MHVTPGFALARSEERRVGKESRAPFPDPTAMGTARGAPSSPCRLPLLSVLLLPLLGGESRRAGEPREPRGPKRAPGRWAGAGQTPFVGQGLAGVGGRGPGRREALYVLFLGGTEASPVHPVSRVLGHNY